MAARGSAPARDDLAAQRRQQRQQVRAAAEVGLELGDHAPAVAVDADPVGVAERRAREAEAGCGAADVDEAAGGPGPADEVSVGRVAEAREQRAAELEDVKQVRVEVGVVVRGEL